MFGDFIPDFISLRILRDHCKLEKHLKTIGLTNLVECRFYNYIGRRHPVPTHLLLDSEVLVNRRLHSLAGYQLEVPELLKLELKKILHFLKAVLMRYSEGSASELRIIHLFIQGSDRP